MRQSCLLVAISVILSASCSGSPTEADTCRLPTPSLTEAPALTLADLPADSSVVAILEWTTGIPEDAEARVEAGHLTLVHRFHYQPALLVRGRAASLIAFSTSDTTAIVTLGAPIYAQGCG